MIEFGKHFGTVQSRQMEILHYAQTLIVGIFYSNRPLKVKELRCNDLDLQFKKMKEGLNFLMLSLTKPEGWTNWH